MQHARWQYFSGGNLVLPDGHAMLNTGLLLHHGVIETIAPDSLPDEAITHDVSGKWITPGLVDQHLHGAFGIDINTASLDQLHRLAAQLPEKGITSFVPTLISDNILSMVAALTRLEECMLYLPQTSARMLGIHLEGPFLNPAYRGAHPESALTLPTEDTMAGLLSPHVKRMTIAPELSGLMDWIPRFREHGILLSLGHSAADYTTAMRAQQAGCQCVTHLYNAMAPFHHRQASALTASLLSDEVYVELICDGQHIATPTIALTLKTKPAEKVILISDCNPLGGQPIGSQDQFGGQTITHQQSGVFNQDGQLAGSASFLSDCVRNLVIWDLASFPQAIQMASQNPATYLGESQHIGQLIPGAQGDLLIWDPADWQIETVLMAGEPIHNKVTA